eukprot:6399464-Amphidinium_carterae.1
MGGGAREAIRKVTALHTSAPYPAYLRKFIMKSTEGHRGRLIDVIQDLRDFQLDLRRVPSRTFKLPN